MKNGILGIVLFCVIFGGFVMLITNLNVSGVTDFEINKDNDIYAGEGEVCSTSTFNIVCKEGLVCATKSGKINFNRYEESGWCQKPIDLEKNQSALIPN